MTAPLIWRTVIMLAARLRGSIILVPTVFQTLGCYCCNDNLGNSVWRELDVHLRILSATNAVVRIDAVYNWSQLHDHYCQAYSHRQERCVGALFSVPRIELGGRENTE